MAERDEFAQLDSFGVNASLFNDGDNALKFYIQEPPQIDEKTYVELEKKINSHGGQVLDKIPHHGVIVYNANKPKSFGARWSDSEKHTVVHMSWIDKCIASNSLEDPDVPMDDEPVPVPLTQLDVPLQKRVLMDMIRFGHQLPIHIHYSIKGPDRSKVCKRIEEYGGFCAVLRSQAHVILVETNEDNMDEIARLRDECWNKDVYVEDRGILERWIKEGGVSLTRPPRKGMPGRRMGAPRTDFTAEDDAILIEHIARQIPDPSSGGRMGFTLYEMLDQKLRARAQHFVLEHDTSPEAEAIKHAARHPVQGWRERYRNLQQWFDQQIEVWLDSHSWVRERGGEFPRALGFERNGRAKKGVPSSTMTPRKRPASASKPGTRDLVEDEEDDEDLAYPPERSPNKRRRVQSTTEKPTAPAAEDDANEVDADFHGDADDFDVGPPKQAPRSGALSEPPPTYRTTAPGSSQFPSTARRGLAVPKYRKPDDPNWPPPRPPAARQTVNIQAPGSPPTPRPRHRSQAPEPPTPHSPVARSTPRHSSLASPVQIRSPAQVSTPATAPAHQTMGEADSELLEVEAELANDSRSDDGRAASLVESSQETIDAPSPDAGVLELLEQAEALQIEIDQPRPPRASEPALRMPHLDLSTLSADQTRYPDEARRASTGGAVKGRPRTSINELMQRAANERDKMVELLRARHGFFFDISVVTQVLQENGDNYEFADDLLTDMRRNADDTRSRATLRRTDTETSDYRPAPRTKAAAVRRVQDEVEGEETEVRPARRTRAAVAAGRA